MRVAEILEIHATSDDTVYVLTRDRRLAQTNNAWRRFALANHGAAMLDRYGPGALLDDAVSPPLRAFYAQALDACLTSAAPWTHEYHCDSPQLHRRFRMTVFPAVEEQMLVTIHALHVEQPHTQEAHDATLPAYTRDGVITMCSHCRKTRHARSLQRWDWVPGLVANMPANVSHGLCEACMAFHFGL